MDILVTGGTGFIGKPLVRGLDAAGHKVRVFARNDDIDRPDGVEIITGDVAKKADLRKAFPADIVYHLAGADEEDPRMWETNVTGTQKVAELCREKKVKQLVFPSSAGVTGESAMPVKEHSKYAPRTKFHRSKAKAERIVKDSGVAYTIVRMPVVVGASVEWAKILDSIKNGYPIIGTGNNKFHVVHADDAVRIMIDVMNNHRAFYNIFNVGTKDLMTYGEVYDVICRTLKVKNKGRFRTSRIAGLFSSIHWMKTAAQSRTSDPHMTKEFISKATSNQALSIKKAKDVLGFEPYYTTPEAIRMTVRDIETI